VIFFHRATGIVLALLRAKEEFDGKILVAINGRQGAWEAVSHAFSLAKRVNVQLNILLVVASGANRGRTPMDVNGRQEVKRRIDLLIESALADGLQVNYFIAEGNFEEEVIKFHQLQQGG